MADALISTPVAISAGVVAATLLGVAGYKVNKEKIVNARIVPLMGVLGSFIFAAQMINFTIPGTGSSGHIIGGILLAAMLGPWAGFLTLASVIIIQCLIFADGGLFALGCNIINMGAFTTLIAYPLIFKPIVANHQSIGRIITASVAASIVGIELGACGVTFETLLSGITALPASSFLTLMTGIHLAIGIGEGLATAAVLSFVAKSRPDLLATADSIKATAKTGTKRVIIIFGISTIILAGGLAFFASEYPDGLEWSIQQLTGSTDLEPTSISHVVTSLEKFQSSTSVMPDYDNKLSGILGALMVVILVWAITSLLTRSHRRSSIGKATDNK